MVNAGELGLGGNGRAADASGVVDGFIQVMSRYRTALRRDLDSAVQCQQREISTEGKYMHRQLTGIAIIGEVDSDLATCPMRGADDGGGLWCNWRAHSQYNPICLYLHVFIIQSNYCFWPALTRAPQARQNGTLF